MKKVLFMCAMLAFATQSYALELSGKDVKVDIEADLKLKAFYVMENEYASASGSDNNDFLVDLQGDSTLGVVFSIKNITLNYVISADEVDYKYFATLDMGKGGLLLVGKEDSLAGYSFGQVSDENNELCDYGAACTNRLPQVTYSIYGFQVSVLKSGDDEYAEDSMTIPGATVAMNNQVIPRFELAYTLGGDNYEVTIFGGYAKFSTKLTIGDDSTGLRLYDDTISADSYLVGFGGEVNAGLIDIMASAYYANNGFLYGALSNEDLMGTLKVDDDGMPNGIEDVISYGGVIGLGINVTETIYISGGFGYMLSTSDSFSEDVESLGYYINATFNVYEYFNIIPEFAVNQTNSPYSSDKATKMYAGVQLQFGF